MLNTSRSRGLEGVQAQAVLPAQAVLSATEAAKHKAVGLTCRHNPRRHAGTIHALPHLARTGEPAFVPKEIGVTSGTMTLFRMHSLLRFPYHPPPAAKSVSSMPRAIQRGIQIDAMNQQTSRCTRMQQRRRHVAQRTVDGCICWPTGSGLEAMGQRDAANGRRWRNIFS